MNAVCFCGNKIVNCNLFVKIISISSLISRIRSYTLLLILGHVHIHDGNFTSDANMLNPLINQIPSKSTT